MCSREREVARKKNYLITVSLLTCHVQPWFLCQPATKSFFSWTALITTIHLLYSYTTDSKQMNLFAVGHLVVAYWQLWPTGNWQIEIDHFILKPQKRGGGVKLLGKKWWPWQDLTDLKIARVGGAWTQFIGKLAATISAHRIGLLQIGNNSIFSTRVSCCRWGARIWQAFTLSPRQRGVFLTYVSTTMEVPVVNIQNISCARDRATVR